jgi:NAD+ kinase
MLRDAKPAPRATSAAARTTSTGRRVVLVVKRSVYSVYVEEKRDKQLTRLLAAGDPSVARLRASHEEHERTAGEVRRALAALGADVVLEASPSDSFDGSGVDLVVTVGGDGTLLAASHSVIDVPVLAVNSAPAHSVGFFCAASRADVVRVLEQAFAGTLRRTELARMRVTVGGCTVAARVLNDALFCHVSPAATSRYILELGDVREEQKSSGFWIGPAAGSTAAQRSAGGRVLPLTSPKLQLVVREAYTPHGERYRLKRALIGPDERLVVRSKIREGRLFFDGPSDVAAVTYGDVLEFSRASESLVLLGLSTHRKWGKR